MIKTLQGRGYLVCLLILFAFSKSGPLLGNDAVKETQPNVLLIMADDQGYGDYSLSGNPYLKTPNLDKLAQRSVRFSNFYVAPVCALTRASLLTGRYAQRTGVRSNNRGYETLHPEEVTMAELFAGAGYRTGLFGKWHLGENYPSVPHGQGFQQYIGFRTGHFDDSYFDPVLEHNGKLYPTRGYITDVLTDEAVRFMSSDKSKPFFCYLPFNAPHTPLDVPDAYLKTFQGLGLTEREARVYGMIANIDDNVGRLLNYLEKSNQLENTIVIYMSDNGPLGGSKKPADWRYNAGLRDQKFTVYEGGIRTHFFISWPERLKEASVKTIAAHIDVLPTLLDICRVPVSSEIRMDGRSLKPLLTSANAPWQDRILFLKYSSKTPDEPAPYPGGIARNQRYKMVNGEELYDLEADPGEKNNIAAQQPDIFSSLEQAYREWWEQMLPPAGFSFLPVPVGYCQERKVFIPPHLGRVKGNLHYVGFRGLTSKGTIGRHANAVDGTWLTNWKSAQDQISWDIEVIKDGTYEVALNMRCPVAEAGSKVRVSIGNIHLDNSVPEAPLKPGDWKKVNWGTIPLQKGKYKLKVEATQVANQIALELGNVIITKVD